jgi:hypothetical protein
MNKFFLSIIFFLAVSFVVISGVQAQTTAPTPTAGYIIFQIQKPSLSTSTFTGMSSPALQQRKPWAPHCTVEPPTGVGVAVGTGVAVGI